MKNRIVTILCATLCLIFGSSCVKGQKAGDPSASSRLRWEGLWVAERSFGPRHKGPVTLHRSGESWVARLQGETMAVDRNQAEDGSVSWSFAFFDHGRFVGRQARSGAAYRRPLAPSAWHDR